ncbi:YfjI family protein [Pseudoxanthomonas mexicana]|uniref:YfjI family protein n=1 Tax=Pseudoxanthomonas mexicana TaxID=128785 RepID=UPI00138A5474|nr:YfjI family protein [Pseudoxanthomonas mexicana]
MSMMFTPPPYPVNAMYSPVRDAIWEVQAQVQAPDAIVAGSFLTAMAVGCQGNADVLLPTGLVRPASLWLAMFGQSGERKTTVDGLVCAPIHEHDKKYAAANAEALAQYGAKLRIWQAVDTALRGKLAKAVQDEADLEQYNDELIAHARREPSKPVPRRIIHQNITERPLVEALHGDGKCVAILSDEGELVLKGGALTKPCILNKGWDGTGTLPLARADGQFVATNPRVTVSFMVQEEVFEQFMDKRGRITRGSGHLARYLVAWPASTVGFRRMTLGDHVWVHLPAFHRRVSELLEQADQRAADGQSRTLLEFSAEAKELWVNVQNGIETQLRPGGQFASIKDFAGKSLEIAGRLAAILHHFNGLEGLISQETLQRALDVVEWHLLEFQRLFGERDEVPQIQRDLRKIGMYLHRRYWSQRLSKAAWNEVRKHNPIRDQDRFEATMWELHREGSIQITYEGKGKRFILLNPAVFSQISHL